MRRAEKRLERRYAAMMANLCSATIRSYCEAFDLKLRLFDCWWANAHPI